MVDMTLFHPRFKERNKNRPILLYVGPILKSRNIKEFLDIPIEGLKRVIGEGRYRHELSRRYPYVEFISPLDDIQLARAYSQADVFVYPHIGYRLEKYIVEALACGLPVAGYPTALMSKVVDGPDVGSVGTSLSCAIHDTLMWHDTPVLIASRVRRARALNPHIGMLVRSIVD